ncbi:MAG: HIT family protein [Candidatus Kapaibacterium sp.]
MSDCIFCDIIAGRAPARIIHRDDSTIAFLSADPEVRGHALVIPLEHIATWPELDETLVSDIFLAVRLVSQQLRAGLSADSVNILLAGGPEAGQSIGHFHIHILPRWSGDGVDAWPILPGYHGDIDENFRAVVGKGEIAEDDVNRDL